MKDLVRVDLHCHSLYSRQNGDSIKWTTSFDAIKQLNNYRVKIASFSDHNIFEVDFYIEVRNLAKTGGILILPGIEVNVVRSDGKIANLIYIFRDDLNYEEYTKISNIAQTIPKLGISLKKSEFIFNEFDLIKIPHVGKNDHFRYEDLIQMSYDAIEISNDNHKNYLSVIKKGLISSIVSFSDTHKWNIYPEQNKLITKIDLDVISFDGLKIAFSKNKNYTKDK